MLPALLRTLLPVLAATSTALASHEASAVEVREVREVHAIKGSNPGNRLRLIRLNCDWKAKEKFLGFRVEYPRGNIPGFGIDPHPPIRFDSMDFQGDYTLVFEHQGLFDPGRGDFPLTFIFYCAK